MGEEKSRQNKTISFTLDGKTLLSLRSHVQKTTKDVYLFSVCYPSCLNIQICLIVLLKNIYNSSCRILKLFSELIELLNYNCNDNILT